MYADLRYMYWTTLRGRTDKNMSVLHAMLRQMDDQRLMSAEQQQLLRTVVTAINQGRDIYGAVRQLPGPEPDKQEMSAILSILRNPDVGFRHGQAPEVALARILALLKAHANGEDTIQPSIMNDRH